MKTIEMERYPICDMCGEEAVYDDKTVYGPWAYLCEKCEVKYGIGVGNKITIKEIKPEDIFK